MGNNRGIEVNQKRKDWLEYRWYSVISKEGLMEMLDILLEIVLCLLVNPLLEIVEVECIGVGDLLDR